MNNFTELKQDDLTDVSGGFIVSGTCLAIIGAELFLFAAAEMHLYHANKALDAKNGNL